MTNAELKEHIKILRAEIKLKELKIKELEKQIFENDFTPISWDDFEKWLLENDKGHYLENPAVSNGKNVEFCKIKDGKLKVGDFFSSVRFPAGIDLYVSFSKSYGEYVRWG